VSRITQVERATAGTHLSEVSREAGFLLLKLSHCANQRSAIPERLLAEWNGFVAKVDLRSPAPRAASPTPAEIEGLTMDVRDLLFSDPTFASEADGKEPKTQDINSVDFSEPAIVSTETVLPVADEPSTQDVHALDFSDPPLDPEG
jgi:hypothetical protein